MAFENGYLLAFDFLTNVRGGSNLTETTNRKLPSWAPNLRRFDCLGSFDLYKSLTFRPLSKNFSSPVGLQLPGVFTATFGSDESLQVKAVFLDTVAAVIEACVYDITSTNLGNPDVGIKYLIGLRNWEARAHGLAMSLKRYPTCEDVSVVYAKTFSFDYLKLALPTSNTEERVVDYAADYTLFRNFMENHEELYIGSDTKQKLQNMNDIASTSHTIHLPSARFLDAFDAYSVGRCFSTTENGYMGWVPEGAEVGDDICVFPWSLIPFVLRRNEMGYNLIGGCFIEAMMKVENIRILHEIARDIKIY